MSDWRALATGAPSALPSDEQIWSALVRELEWLYRQMDRSLRRCIAPVLALFELKTIVLGVRNKAAERGEEIRRLLGSSLLCDRVQRALRQPADVRSTIAALAEALSAGDGDFRSLATAYSEGGLQGFENELMRAYLARVVAGPLNRVIRRFFSSFIDLRNLMILYKHLRWEIEQEARYIPGGTVEAAHFAQAAAGTKQAGLDALVREATGLAALPAAASEGALETALLAWLTDRLRRIGREDEDVGLFLDYAWRNYVQARNLAVLCHARELGPETMERELIA